MVYSHLRKLLSYRQKNKLLEGKLKIRLIALSYLFHSLKVCETLTSQVKY